MEQTKISSDKVVLQKYKQDITQGLLKIFVILYK